MTDEQTGATRRHATRLVSHPAVVGPRHVVQLKVRLDADHVDNATAERGDARKVAMGVIAEREARHAGYRVHEVEDVLHAGDAYVVTLLATGDTPDAPNALLDDTSEWRYRMEAPEPDAAGGSGA